MTRRTTVATAIIAATTVLALHSGAIAQTGSAPRTPAQSDFDLCNREAQVASGGSAAPRTGTAPSGGVGGAVSGGATSGVPGAAGATGGTGSLSDGSTLSGGSTISGGDPTLRGIATGGGSDPAFQQAYRDCMQRRGF